jgi:hypothetical protein
LGQFPADATHLKLAVGDVEAMLSVARSVGTLSIEIIE